MGGCESGYLYLDNHNFAGTIGDTLVAADCSPHQALSVVITGGRQAQSLLLTHPYIAHRTPVFKEKDFSPVGKMLAMLTFMATSSSACLGGLCVSLDGSSV